MLLWYTAIFISFSPQCLWYLWDHTDFPKVRPRRYHPRHTAKKSLIDKPFRKRRTCFFGLRGRMPSRAGCCLRSIGLHSQSTLRKGRGENEARIPHPPSYTGSHLSSHRSLLVWVVSRKGTSLDYADYWHCMGGNWNDNILCMSPRPRPLSSEQGWSSLTNAPCRWPFLPILSTRIPSMPPARWPRTHYFDP